MVHYEHLCVQIANGVAELALNRPAQRNALSLELLAELIACCEALGQRHDVRVVILSGQGSSFSVGFDLMGLAPLFAQGALPAETQLKDWARLGHKAVLALANLPQISIASAQGHAIGGGFLLLAACDFRLAENETRFALPEIDIGLPLTWGGVDRLMHLLGEDLAKDLVLTARSFGPKDLQHTSFLYRAVTAQEHDEAVTILVETMLVKPAPALRLCKEQFLAARNQAFGHVERDAQHFVDALLHPDFLSTAMAYVQRIAGPKPDL